jgi:hypothetical protein
VRTRQLQGALRGRVGLELFSRDGFGGERRAFTGAQSDLRRVGFNDAARSLRVGQRETWEICVDINFVNCRVVNSDWQVLNQLGMSQRISSVRPWRQGGGGGRAYLVLYDDRGYRGQSYRVERESHVLSGVTNRAESVHVSGGSWELCDRSSFGGRCVVVSGNVPDLSSIGLGNRVASARLVPTPR